MMKHLKLLALVGTLVMLNENVQGKPQDISDAAIMAFAQVKDTVDNGAAASDKREFEFFGAKVKNEMGVGFGDAVRSKRSNRLPISEPTSPLIHNSQLQRDKRAANFSVFTREIVNSKEMSRFKRGTDENSIEVGNSAEDYDYSSSSSSSSSESEEDERRKRSVAYDKLLDTTNVS